MAASPKPLWSGLKTVDDVALTEGADGEADVTRAVVVDEEALAAAVAAGLAGDDEEEPLQQLDPQAAAAWYAREHLEQAKLLLSGGVAGAFSKSCTAPLARLTILYQVGAAGGGTGVVCVVGDYCVHFTPHHKAAPQPPTHLLIIITAAAASQGPPATRHPLRRR